MSVKSADTGRASTPGFRVIRTVLRELFTRERSPRVPEPDLIMDDPDKVAAFTRAGRVDGVMAPLYLFNCAHICELLRPADTVLDLGCGPATQLAMVAALNPQTQFLGVDLSADMLSNARDHVDEQGLANVRFQRGDMSELGFLAAGSVDTVFSTVSLHHLPDVEALARTFTEIARVLKPGGGVYLVDFAHLKSERAIDFFAHQNAHHQPELFTLDYLYSLRAAFRAADFRHLTATKLTKLARAYTMFPLPLMVAVKSHPRAMPTIEVRSTLQRLKRELPTHCRRDMRDLLSLFRLGSLRTRWL